MLQLQKRPAQKLTAAIHKQITKLIEDDRQIFSSIITEEAAALAEKVLTTLNHPRIIQYIAKRTTASDRELLFSILAAAGDVMRERASSATGPNAAPLRRWSDDKGWDFQTAICGARVHEILGEYYCDLEAGHSGAHARRTIAPSRFNHTPDRNGNNA